MDTRTKKRTYPKGRNRATVIPAIKVPELLQAVKTFHSVRETVQQEIAASEAKLDAVKEQVLSILTELGAANYRDEDGSEWTVKRAKGGGIAVQKKHQSKAV